MSPLNYTIHHVFMPPKLPQKDDYIAEYEEALCQTIHESAMRYASSGLLGPEDGHVWDFVVKMLSAITQSQASDGMSIDAVEEDLMKMQEGCEPYLLTLTILSIYRNPYNQLLSRI